MPNVKVGDLNFEYEEFGSHGNPCVLLIMGLGTQMTAWPVSLCEGLAAKGYHVVRYDNRDVGLSSHLDHQRAPNLRWVLLKTVLGMKARVPYTLDDMASDAIGLLDELNIDKAHVVGASMGGMIAQIAAAQFPERILTLTSIMSTTGHRSLPRGEPEAIKALMLRPKDPNSRESILARNRIVRRAIQSPDYPLDEETLERTIAESLDRGGYRPDSVARHLSAIITAKHRRDLLAKVAAPALVIHGEQDPLVKLESGEDTAKHLPNAKLVTFPGMGHDLPEALVPDWVELIDELAKSA